MFYGKIRSIGIARSRQARNCAEALWCDRAAELLEGVAEAHRCKLQQGQASQGLKEVGPWGSGNAGASVKALVRAKVVWAPADWTIMALLMVGLVWLLVLLLPELQLSTRK